MVYLRVNVELDPGTYPGEIYFRIYEFIDEVDSTSFTCPNFADSCFATEQCGADDSTFAAPGGTPRGDVSVSAVTKDPEDGSKTDVATATAAAAASATRWPTRPKAEPM